MKLLFRLSILIFFSSLSFTYAQIGINTQTPDPSSAFDITSSSGGILIPRLTNSQKNNISNPATGLMIYQIDSTPGFYFYNGTSWEQLITSVNLLVTSSKIVDGTITSSDLSSGIDATKIGSGLVTDTEFGYIDGLTSSAQTQITGLGTDITTNTTAISANTSSITTLSSTISNLTDSDTTYSSGSGLTLSGTTFSIDSSVVTSTYTGGVTINGTVTATKFVGDGSGLTGVTTTSLGDDIVTSSKIVDGTITSSDLSSGIDATKIGSGLVTDTEFGYIDGLTSSAQTQITGLGTDITTNTTAISANTSSITTLSSTISNLTDSDTTYSSGSGLTLSGTTFSIDSSVVTSTYTGGVTINGTVTATKFVGDGSGLTGVTTTSLGDDIVTSSKIVDGTITSSDLSSGIDATKIGSGLVTDTEFGYIDGLTSSAQTQITGLGTDITTNTTAISANTSSITTLSSTISNLTDSDTTYSSGSGLTLSGTTFSIDSSVVTSTYTGGVTINGTVTATKFVGDGSGLTGISSSSSGLINAGYYSTTEINNLSPNLGDIVYDYTSATLKIYASTPGNYNQKRLSWDTNRTSYNGFNQTAISDKYYYSGKIIKDCYINYLTYYNTMDSQYKHGFVYKDTDRELSNGKGYKVPDGTFFKAGDYIHFEFLSSNANLVDNSQPNTSSSTVYRWNSEYDNNEFLEYIDSFTFKIFYQTRVDAGYPESQWYVDSNNYFALSVGIAPVNKSFKTIIDY